MPEAVVVSVAKAVEQHLRANTFSKVIDPQRNYADGPIKLEDDLLHVDVVVHTTKQQYTMLTPGLKQYTVPVEILVRQRLGEDQQDLNNGNLLTESIDELMLLVEEIEDAFSLQRLTEFSAASWVSTEIVVAPDVDMLVDNRQFFGLVRVTFQAEIERP